MCYCCSSSEFFTSSLTGDFSLSDSKFHQASRSLSWFQQCCDLDGLNSSSDCQFPQSLSCLWGLFQGVQLHLILLLLSCFTTSSAVCQGPGICPSFCFTFIFSLWSAGMSIFTGWQVLFFLLTNTRSGLLARIWLFYNFFMVPEYYMDLIF